MVTPVDVGAAAGKFAIGIATRRIFDFFKRRKLRAAYGKAAVTVFTRYENTGIHSEHPSWLGISRLIRSEECGTALSMGGDFTEDVQDSLQRIYDQDDPSLLHILGGLASEIRTHARDTLPLDFQTLEDLFSTRLNLLRTDVKGIGEQIERQTKDIKRIVRSGGNSKTSQLFVGVPSLSTHEIFGRDELLSEMTERLISGDSIALSAQGLPGVGKTTLAIALANSDEIREYFTDGILWAGLGPDADVMRHLAIWADELRIDMTGIPMEEDRSQAVKNAVGQRRMLLVIDDAWDIRDANLMKCGGPNCVHLLTTRNQEIARDFAGPEGTQNVPVLEDPDAFEMLKFLAPEACDADPEAARKLAEAVACLPLALELLGRYLAAPERSYFADLSEQAFEEMADPNRRLKLAQRRLGDITSSDLTLSETISLSLDDLPSNAVNAFHALGAFASKPESFDLDAAVAVAEVETQTLALLISRSLLEKDGGRLTMHQTLADFARQNMPSEASTRHWDHYLALVNEDREDWRRIEFEYAQIQWAWSQAEESERLLDMIYALRIYQERRGLWQDSLDWANIGLKVTEEHEIRGDTATLLNNIGMVYDALGQREKALEFYNQALPIMDEVGDRSGAATTLNNIGMGYNALGQREKALEF